MTKEELLNLIVTLENLYADIKESAEFVGGDEKIETDYLIALTQANEVLSKLYEKNKKYKCRLCGKEKTGDYICNCEVSGAGFEPYTEWYK